MQIHTPFHPGRSPRFAMLSLALFVLLFVAYDAQAQWPRGKGKGYVQLSVGRADASRGFDANRNRGPLGSLENPETYDEAQTSVPAWWAGVAE